MLRGCSQGPTHTITRLKIRMDGAVSLWLTPCCLRLPQSLGDISDHSSSALALPPTAPYVKIRLLQTSLLLQRIRTCLSHHYSATSGLSVSMKSSDMFTTRLAHLEHGLVSAFHEVRMKCKQEGGEICDSILLLECDHANRYLLLHANPRDSHFRPLLSECLMAEWQQEKRRSEIINWP